MRAAALAPARALNGLAKAEPRLHEAARQTGADVPSVSSTHGRLMRGIGAAPVGAASTSRRFQPVLVNPGRAVPNQDVFAKLGLAAARPAVGRRDSIPASQGSRRPSWPIWASIPNDLGARPGRAEPVFDPQRCSAAAVRSEELRLRPHVGPAATCFGLFGSDGEAADAAQALAFGPARRLKLVYAATVLEQRDKIASD